VIAYHFTRPCFQLQRYYPAYGNRRSFQAQFTETLISSGNILVQTTFARKHSSPLACNVKGERDGDVKINKKVARVTLLERQALVQAFGMT